MKYEINQLNIFLVIRRTRPSRGKFGQNLEKSSKLEKRVKKKKTLLMLNDLLNTISVPNLKAVAQKLTPGLRKR